MPFAPAVPVPYVPSADEATFIVDERPAGYWDWFWLLFWGNNLSPMIVLFSTCSISLATYGPQPYLLAATAVLVVLVAHYGTRIARLSRQYSSDPVVPPLRLTTYGLENELYCLPWCACVEFAATRDAVIIRHARLPNTALLDVTLIPRRTCRDAAAWRRLQAELAARLPRISVGKLLCGRQASFAHPGLQKLSSAMDLEWDEHAAAIEHLDRARALLADEPYLRAFAIVRRGTIHCQCNEDREAAAAFRSAAEATRLLGVEDAATEWLQKIHAWRELAEFALGSLTYWSRRTHRFRGEWADYLAEHLTLLRMKRVRALHELSDLEAAACEIEVLLAASQTDIYVWKLLSEQYRHERRFDAALETAAHILTLDPATHIGWTEQGRALQELGRFAEALAAFERACAIEPQGIVTRADLAMALATFPEPAMRNGRRALDLAREAILRHQACVQTGDLDDPHAINNPHVLFEVEACAYAEVGDFALALVSLEHYLREGGNPAFAALRRARFERREPVRLDADGTDPDDVAMAAATAPA